MALEKAIVVDENDTILCYKNRHEILATDMVRIVIIWVENSHGDALIHLRSKNKQLLPGLWENAAGGGVAHNETYLEAAKRELAEEIGLKSSTLQFVTKHRIDTPIGPKMCSWFKVVVNMPIDQFAPNPHEVDELRWVNKEWLFNDRDANPENYMPSAAHWRKHFS